jgi:hypothetical protein
LVGTVVHTYNPNYLGGRDEEKCYVRLTLGKKPKNFTCKK